MVTMLSNERAKSSRYKVVWRIGKDVGAKFSARRDGDLAVC